MIRKQTTLDLNGPVLSFSTQPGSLSSCNAGVAVTFVGVATATFPTQSPTNTATGSGYIEYQWYLEGHGALTDTVIKGSRIAGSATTHLTIYSPKSPTINAANVYLRADYIPSAYVQPSTSEVTAGTARSTGNAVIDPINSNTASLTVYPKISVTSNPTDKNSPLDTNTTFSVSVNTTDTTVGTLTYNWQINGVDITSSRTSATYITQAVNKYLLIGDTTTQVKTLVDFSQIGEYSNFESGKEYTIVSNVDVEVDLYAVGGGGGEETYRGAQGGSGGSASGTITLIRDQPYKLIVGGGAVNAVGGYGGGGNGSTGGAGGVSGGGGGYTGLFLDSVSHSNAILIAGGGGGAANGPAQGGNGGGTTGADSSNVSGNGGSGGTQSAGGTGGNPGSELQGGSGSAAGGGGGYYGGGGGVFSSGCCSDGAGGGGSGYINSSLVTNGSFAYTDKSEAGGHPGANGSFKLVLKTETGTATVNASGFNTPNLTLSTNAVGIFPVRCKISHTSACNSPIYSKTANFSSIIPRDILNFEYIDTVGTSDAILNTVNLEESGCIILNAENTGGRIISFYPPEKNVEVVFDMYGAKGLDSGSYKGGQGGTSALAYTLKRNVEYVIAPLPFSGSNGGIYLYEKSNLLASVGSGGNAGTSGAGGNGGGVDVKGDNGFGRSAGNGGAAVEKGTLSSSGYYPGYWTGGVVAPDFVNPNVNGGGRVLSCTRGDYWRDQGFTSCEDIGKQRFFRADGFEVKNTSNEITRGFKSGYSIRQTSGRASSNGGNGGFGVVGGDGGINGSGGGGGSGYQNGQMEVIYTGSGGNNDVASITLCLRKDFYFVGNIISVYPGAGTVGSRSGFTNGDATGRQNGFRYDAPPATQNYIAELQVTNDNWINSHGFVGVCDETHWQFLNWTSASNGARMMYYLGQNFSYGEETGPYARGGTGSLMYDQSGYTQGVYKNGDIVGIAVNQRQGRVSIYKNGIFVCSIRNDKAVNTRLYVAVSDWFFSRSLACRMLEARSQYYNSYIIPSV